MSSKNVKFGGDSTSSGSRSSRGHGHRRSDDSGVGSFSDHDSRGSNPDRAFTASDYETQRYSTTALQEALTNAVEVREQWKKKAIDLDILLSQRSKDLKESEARSRALSDRNEILELEKNTITKEKKAALEENDSLRDQLKALQEKLERAQRKLEKNPVMSGAIPTFNDAPKRRSSMSAPKVKRDKEAERVEKEKEKLRERFTRGDESDRSGSSTKTHRSRRDSYIEPMGPPAQRPMPAPVPPSPTRHFNNFTTTPQYPPQFTTIREPVTGQVPRAIRPTVTAVYDDSVFDEFEDGNYHAFPLPNHSSSRDRR